MKEIWQKGKSDPFWRWLLPVFLLLQLPSLLSALDLGPRIGSAAAYSSLGLLALVAATLVAVTLGNGPDRDTDFRERRFWRVLVAGYCLWWLRIAWLVVLPGSGLGSVTLSVLESLLGGFFLAWFWALGIAPHRPASVSRYRLLRAAGAAVMILGLLTYFATLRDPAGAGHQPTWLPAPSSWLVLDSLVTIMLLRRVVTCGAARWRVLYGFLTLTMLLATAADGLRLALAWEVAADLLQNLSFLPLVAALRGHRYLPRRPPSRELEDDWFRRPSPLMLSALVFPLIHIGGTRLGLLSAASEPSRERVVLVCLLLLGVLASIENLWLRRSAEEGDRQHREVHDLRVAREVAERSEASKSRFLAKVSHQVKVPMSGILDAARDLVGSDLPPPERRHAELLAVSAGELSNTLDGLLEYSEIEAGKLRLIEGPLSLRGVVGQVVDDFAGQAADKGLELSFRIDDEVPDAVICDGARLRKVLSKLMSNAVKFTAEGRVGLEVSAPAPGEAAASLTGSERRVWVRFLVEDTGIGVPAEIRPLLFEPFSQEDTSSTRRFGGTGLGLAISQQIVFAMGGRIDLHGEAGGGSRFTVTLPLATAPERRG